MSNKKQKKEKNSEDEDEECKLEEVFIFYLFY